MKYSNPVLRGMYPDPSACRAGDKYYMVCSTFMYFPAVPLFESDDMVNWRQIGHCLTRKSQIDLSGTGISGGIFAPTIRFNDGRFYMVTTNASIGKNFYVYTDDIYGEWSEPVEVEQDGIDPTLYFEDGRVFFISNGVDVENGVNCIRICEIDVETGKKLSATRPLWLGMGGRYIEAPHLYKIGKYYYILDAEGGTEYGHMVNYARSENMFGPFEPFANNPALTNRNLGGYPLQGAGHGDLIEDKNGKWWFIHLAFRQSGQWTPYHHLGREVCLVPVERRDDWFYFGDGTCCLEYDIDRRFETQKRSYKKNFESIGKNGEWCFIRNYLPENYDFGTNSLTLTGTADSLFSGELPSFAGVRQCEFCEEICVNAENGCGCEEAGITVFMDESHHYDLYLDGEANVVLRFTIGCVSKIMCSIPIESHTAELYISTENFGYNFFTISDGKKTQLGYADSKYLSSEVAGGFTGVVIALYVVDKDGKRAVFRDLTVEHCE